MLVVVRGPCSSLKWTILLIDKSNNFTITSGVKIPSYLTFEQASSKTHFQPVQSSFLHYELVFYSIAKEGNFRPGKASFDLQEPFSGKLVFYRNPKERNCARWKASFCPQEPFSDYANFNTRQSAIYSQDVQMKFRMSRILRFWVDVEYEAVKNLDPNRRKSDLIAQILREFEEAGDAMRYVDTKGEIARKATPRMLSRLADAEQEARDDELAEWS
jgi:hypothetical protein